MADKKNTTKKSGSAGVRDRDKTPGRSRTPDSKHGEKTKQTAGSKNRGGRNSKNDLLSELKKGFGLISSSTDNPPPNVAAKLAASRRNAAKSKKDPKRIAARVIVWSLVAMLSAYVIYQVYFSFYAHIDAETALEVTVEDTIETTGISIRNETIVTTEKTGMIVGAVESGGKVSKGEVIARVFDSADAAEAYQRIGEIDHTLERFENMSTAAEETTSGISSVEKQLGERMLTLSKTVHSGELGDIDKLRDDILYLLNKQQIATRMVESFDSRVSGLQSERDALASGYTAEPQPLTSPKSGYFINNVDGYESLLSTSVLDSLTPIRMEQILESKENNDNHWVVGKIADDYIWYIACEVTDKQSERLEKDKAYTLKLPYSEIGSVRATLRSINIGDDTSRALLVFECTYMVSELSDIRQQPVTIVLDSATGLEINKSSVAKWIETSGSDAEPNADEEDEGAVGEVYIVWGNEVKMRKVSVIYEKGEKIICKTKTGAKGWLQMFDDVIVEPEDLYDGKIINATGRASDKK